MLLSALRKWWRPEVQPDQKVIDAAERQETEAMTLKVAIADAKRRGVFERMHTAIRQAADEDSERIQRARRRR